jgi:hypothetical protein
MEQYAEWMLLPLHSYRDVTDLSPVAPIGRFSYGMKLREIHENDNLRDVAGHEKRVFNTRNLTFLQIIQNSAYNSLRYKVSTDDLQSITHVYSVKVFPTCENVEENDDEEEETDELPYEVLLDHCDSEALNDADAHFLPNQLQNYSFKPLRNGGTHGCVFSPKIPSLQVARPDSEWVVCNSPIERSKTSHLRGLNWISPNFEMF